ncbi:hypothetical protein [Pseudomonas nitroreducens]|uniref:hypothetical protein n=1 Tax=Pseudomonas nitroreducens TaxID=46680 RepID=UPI00351CF2BC
MKILLYFLGSFVLFAASGYAIGTKYAYDKNVIAARIANSSTIELRADNKLILTYRDENGAPLWSQNLIDNKGGFSDVHALELSLTPRVAEAKSELLIAFLGGGLSLTGAGVYKFLASNSSFQDWRIKAAIFVGGATGYSVGYWIAVHTVDNDSPEVLDFLTKKENQNLVKRLVFVSMVKNLGLSGEDDSKSLVTSSKKMTFECGSKSRVDCYSESPKFQEIIKKTAGRQELIQQAVERLSSDDYIIEGRDFLGFFI